MSYARQYVSAAVDSGVASASTLKGKYNQQGYTKFHVIDQVEVMGVLAEFLDQDMNAVQLQNFSDLICSMHPIYRATAFCLFNWKNEHSKVKLTHFMSLGLLTDLAGLCTLKDDEASKVMLGDVFTADPSELPMFMASCEPVPEGQVAIFRLKKGV